jgi:hypothetical protein
MDLRLTLALIALLLLATGACVVLLDKHALRDRSSLIRKPYSLARVQLWWWTVLVLVGWILAYGINKQLLQLNATCLALLGISVATTSTARLIDMTDSTDGARRHQDTEELQSGFFVDLVSDERGLSLHRLQSVAFHFVYGAAFLVDVISANSSEFPSFDVTTLALLGLSSVTYLTLKALENRATPSATAMASSEGQDQLLDACDPAPGSTHDSRSRTARVRD